MPSTVYDAILGALTLKQVTRSGYSLNGEPIVGRASGAPAPSEYFGGESAPQADFDSADIAGVLGAISVSAGLAVSSGTITIPYNKRASGGTFAGTLAHFTLNGTNGLIVPSEFSVNQGDPAALAKLMCHFRSTNGIAEPVSESINQTLAAQSFNAMYALGPGSINGNTIDQLQGIVVTPGITVLPQYQDGGIYPTDLFIQTQQPTIDYLFEDLDAIETFSAQFTVMTAAIAYFRKRSGVSFVSDATEEHVKFSFADGIVSTQSIQSSDVNNGQATLRCYGEALTATASSAIS